MNHFSDLYKRSPERIEPLVKMGRPNESILIYKGKFVLKSQSNEYDCDGRAEFFWFPHTEIRLTGTTLMRSTLIDDYQSNVLHSIFIDNCFVGSVMLMNFQRSDHSQVVIGGRIAHEFFLGDKTIRVNKLHFEIANHERDFLGEIVRSKDGLNKARLVLEDESNEIHIDKISEFKTNKEALENEGGFILLCTANIIKKKGDYSYEETKHILNCLYYFLSFLNGKRTSPLFVKGVFDTEVIWQDFTFHKVDQYKPVWAWAPNFEIAGIKNLWREFSSLSKSDNDFDCLKTAIHWYAEANKGAGYAEGSIMMIQNALELLYNWIVVEKRRIIKGEDSKNISAANKIRLLLSQIKLSSEIPFSLKALVQFSNGVLDGPESLVQIRNAIVHSQEEKRKKLNSISPHVLIDTLNLGIWYVELAILSLLNYDGKYVNRCAVEKYRKEVSLPWI